MKNVSSTLPQRLRICASQILRKKLLEISFWSYFRFLVYLQYNVPLLPRGQMFLALKSALVNISATRTFWTSLHVSNHIWHPKCCMGPPCRSKVAHLHSGLYLSKDLFDWAGVWILISWLVWVHFWSLAALISIATHFVCTFFSWALFGQPFFNRLWSWKTLNWDGTDVSFILCLFHPKFPAVLLFCVHLQYPRRGWFLKALSTNS